jgi:hypothetical protein
MSAERPAEHELSVAVDRPEDVATEPMLIRSGMTRLEDPGLDVAAHVLDDEPNSRRSTGPAVKARSSVSDAASAMVARASLGDRHAMVHVSPEPKRPASSPSPFAFAVSICFATRSS